MYGEIIVTLRPPRPRPAQPCVKTRITGLAVWVGQRGGDGVVICVHLCQGMVQGELGKHPPPLSAEDLCPLWDWRSLYSGYHAARVLYSAFGVIKSCRLGGLEWQCGSPATS